MKSISQYKVIIFSSILFVLFYNFSFFEKVFKTYQLESTSIFSLISVVILLISLTIFFFTLLSSRYTTKPLLILTFFVSAFTAYFMDTYHVVIDDGMIRNSLETNLEESSDLFSFQLVLYVFFLGLLPSYLIYKTKIDYSTLKKEFFAKLKVLILSLSLILIILFSFSKFYTSFFREHKQLRYHVNPIYWIYSIGSYINKTLNSEPILLKEIGRDAKITPEKTLEEEEKKRVNHYGCWRSCTCW